MGTARFRKESILLPIDKLKGRVKRAAGSVVFGYAQPYAVLQHETHESAAKFLEKPFRRMKSSGRIKSEIISEYHANNGDVTGALMKAAGQVIEESQIDVPVLTGALRASTFIAPKKNKVSAIATAKAEGDAIRELNR